MRFLDLICGDVPVFGLGIMIVRGLWNDTGDCMFRDLVCVIGFRLVARICGV